MILQSLCQFYRSGCIEFAPFGFEEKPVPFLIVINDAGEFVSIEDTRQTVGKRKISQTFQVPQAVKKTSGISANLLWDVAEYVLGLDFKENPEKTHKQFSAFRTRLEPFCEDDEVQAVHCFLAGLNLLCLQKNEHWQEIVDTNCLLSFKLEGRDHLVCQSGTFLDLYRQSLENHSESTFLPCLVTGDITTPVLLHPAIKKLPGAQSSGANIVSFNLPAFTSWSKKQGHNAPTSQHAAFEYTTALNYLLQPDNEHSIQVGNRTFLFWSETAKSLQSVFKSFFVESTDSETNAVDEAYDIAFQSQDCCAEDRFNVLGLAPNNARISVCLWHRIRPDELLNNLSIWFEDLAMKGLEKFGRSSLERLLRCTCLQFKTKYLSDKLTVNVLESMLKGSRLPHSLMVAVLNRIRADEGKVSYTRASLLKAFINRKYRHEGKNNMQLTTALDEENNQTGYVLGRLFSVFERLQEEAHRSNLSTTISSRYFGGASIRPQSVFNTLFKLHIHHLRKLQNPGRVVNFRQMIGDLMQKIGNIPSHLSSEQQCLFAVGYYHQRQAFYSSNKEPEIDDEDDHEFE
ncbi:type I-C CRISPR-associated protein Cas8c/Csd1 [Endozoicomonas euniceicola]|uniref:Type I-C CRISPR-associated protein Cas8c/Csd1 n=1 Tax=Endozoicomonas euniceicola TaxID=1234143 RepID=A0ABY6GQ93_9GAMM|nr:type I-C CRISPR-associated protein Cas8c/Csd1 [Endozoicomonas euniceicola]UYM14907.1 type I-C CRISPR-associated protein Cas8c/Csd1 [Endozoicomonas euniceicola]